MCVISVRFLYCGGKLVQISEEATYNYFDFFIPAGEESCRVIARTNIGNPENRTALVNPCVPYTQSTSLEAVMPELDVLYMTRVQRERFFNEEDYLRLRDSYILTPDKLETAKPDMSILHPLPRVNEIAAAVDNDPRACYFRQAKNGRYIRMALMLKLLGID